MSFTLTQLRDNFGPADWYPNDHPQMPDIVAHGHKPNVTACSCCHYPNGKGRPVNTNLAGLPYAYILQTLADFKNGARRSSDTRKANTNQMTRFAKSMNDDEIKAAAQYFSSMKWTSWIWVVETDTVPKMRIANGIFLPVEGEAREPLGQRIIETPENVEATEVLRDDRYGFIAYVPVGSINKGAALVMAGGGGKATQCTICHGADLTGLGLGLRLARPLSQLSRAPALSHAARHAFRGGEGPDDTGGYQIDDRRHVGDSRLSSFAERPVGVCNRRAKLAGFAAQHPSNALLFDGRLCGLRRSVPRQNPF